MKQHFYLYKGAQKDFEKMAQKHYVVQKKLKAITLKDAYVLPVQFYREGGQGYAKGGVVDVHGNYVPSSARYRGIDGTRQACSLMGGYEFSKKDVSVITAPCIYCGDYMPHYGHFLCESMTRLWYVIQHYQKGTKLIFINNEPKEVKGNYREIFELLGVDLRDVLILSEVTQCQNIVIPDASSVFCEWCTPEFAMPFKAIFKAVKKKYKYEKLYLSRTHFKDRFIIGEKNVEQLFRQNGYHVLYPEELSLSELIAYFKNAKIVAGLSGTGLHNIAFSHPGTRLVILNRSNLANPAQEMINQSRGVVATYVDVHFNYLAATNSVFLVGLTPPLKRFAQSLKMKIRDIPALTKGEIKTYFKRYMAQFDREVMWRHEDSTLRDVWPAVLQSVALPKDEHIFVKLKYFILSKICWGKKAEKYRQYYHNIVEK